MGYLQFPSCTVKQLLLCVSVYIYICISVCVCVCVCARACVYVCTTQYLVRAHPPFCIYYKEEDKHFAGHLPLN